MKHYHTVDGQNPAPPGMVKTLNNGIIIILGGAGFCPSTVPFIEMANVVEEQAQAQRWNQNPPTVFYFCVIWFPTKR